MKHYFILTISLLTLCFTMSTATDFTISTVGNSYSPTVLNVEIGDRVTIQASVAHPTTQVSLDTWNANGTTPIGGGFSGNTSQFTIDIVNLGTIYYVCENHVVADNMKGQIIVSATTGFDEGVNRIGFEVINNPIVDFMAYRIESPEYEQSIMTLYTTAGQEVQSIGLAASNGRVNVDVPSGVYLYTVRSRDDELLATGKLMVTER